MEYILLSIKENISLIKILIKVLFLIELIALIITVIEIKVKSNIIIKKKCLNKIKFWEMLSLISFYFVKIIGLPLIILVSIVVADFYSFI